jgi:hypothetical protein
MSAPAAISASNIVSSKVGGVGLYRKPWSVPQATLSRPLPPRGAFEGTEKAPVRGLVCPIPMPQGLTRIPAIIHPKVSRDNPTDAAGTNTRILGSLLLCSVY